MSDGVGGGGEFRHCCRKQWRFSADNYFVRELTGKFNLDQVVCVLCVSIEGALITGDS